MKHRVISALTALLSILMAVSLTACGGGKDSQADPSLLEFPGLGWNDTPEAVLEAMKLDQEHIAVNQSAEGSSERNLWLVEAEDVPCFGGSAKVRFWFTQYLGTETENPLGLSRIEIYYSEDADMDAVRDELTRLYGEGSQKAPGLYMIEKNELVDRAPKQEGTMTVNWPGESPFSYKLSPNEHKLYWADSGKNLLPDGMDEKSCAPLFDNGGKPVSEDVVSQWLEQTALVQLSWTDAYVLEDGGLKPNHQVIFDGNQFVALMQNCM